MPRCFPRTPASVLASLLALATLCGCATGREKDPIMSIEREEEVLRAKAFDAWSTRSSKGSLYLLFELKEGWKFRRPPTPQSTAGGIQPGRSGPTKWEMTFVPIGDSYRLATGVTTITVFWEAGGPDGSVRAGRTQAIVSISENLALTLLDFANEEKETGTGSGGPGTGAAGASGATGTANPAPAGK